MRRRHGGAAGGKTPTPAGSLNDYPKDVRSRKVGESDFSLTWWHGIIVVILYVAGITVSMIALYRVPEPLSADAPPGLFSEGRAMQTVMDLSDSIPFRQVGSVGVEMAAQYMLDRCNELKELAERTRPDLLVQVDREYVSGAASLMAVGVHISNAYRNLTNVILRIAPRSVNGTKAVLVNSHFDSVFGTPGASDCAGCVAVALESARAIVADATTILAAPAVFLFNGGEELILLAAHGFMNQSRHVGDLGAFINLESTGPGGPDVVFQSTGAWTAAAYARSAVIPRGSVLGQDIFDARLVSMDTDFRMFSYRHKGTLPGIDIAQILDGSAYHSKNDNAARIRKGTLQACGENTLALLLEFARELKRQETVPLSEIDAEGSVYVDLLSLVLVHYPASLGRALHTAPFIVLAVAAVLSAATSGKSLGAASGQLARALAVAVASLICACSLPAAVGIVRVLLSDKPLAWFSRLWAAYAVYVPAALAGLLIPYAAVPDVLEGIRTPVFATTLVQAGLAAGLAYAGAKSAFGCAAWGYAGLLSLLAPPQAGVGLQLVWALLSAAPAALLDAPIAVTLPVFIMEHLSLAGARGPMWAGDAVAGLLLGFAGVMTTGFLLPWLAKSFRRSLKVLVLLLMLASAGAATWVSISGNVYTEQHAKRVMVQHLSQLAPDGNIVDSRWVVGGLDMTPIERVLPPGRAYNQSEDVDFQALYPISKLIRGVTFPAPRPDKPTFQYKKIAIVLIEQYTRSGTARAHLELRLPRPGWGSLNISGPVLGWSFTDTLPGVVTTPGEWSSHMTRFAGNEGSQVWPFWVDLQGHGALRVELSVFFQDQTPALRNLERQLPSWTTISLLTTFQASWEF